MNKLLRVVAGQIDIEGGSGGWLVLRNHLIFVPARRAFSLRTSEAAIVDVVHLDPADTAWAREGCWTNMATKLATEMIAHALALEARPDRDPTASRLYYRTIGSLCRDWFANPRMLFMPAAASPEMRGIVGYVRDNLENATISGASAAVGVPQRTLHRRCRQEFGVSMRTFLREARIMRAMELLSSEDRTVGSVAASVGFNSPAAFTSTFSRRLGISPGEFMRVNRSGQQAREAD